MKNLEEMKKELEELQKIEEEVWRKIPDFPNYEVSNFGKVRSLGFEVYKTPPGEKDKSKKSKYIYKGKILSPLRTGVEQKWIAYRIIQRQGVYKQISGQKLMLSAFLDVKLSELPRFVFKKNKKISEISLKNLSFDHGKNGHYVKRKIQ